MADQLVEGSFGMQRFKDMGDGTFAPVVSAVTTQGAGSPTTPQYTRIEDGQSNALATVAQFHNADNQIIGTGNGLLTGGVAQLLNASGNLDRQRETGTDSVPAAGIATGAAQFAMAFLTTDADNFASGVRTFTPSAMSGTIAGVPWSIQQGSVLVLDTGTNAETVVVATVTATTFTATTTKAHNGSVTPFNVAGFVYNQERDAAGELDTATGAGTAVAAEYEYIGGHPVDGTNYERVRALRGLGLSSLTITAGGGSGSKQITLFSAPGTSLQAGQTIHLSGGTAEETVHVAPSYTPGSATVPLVGAIQNGTQTLATWNSYSATGPGLGTFLVDGEGAEVCAILSPAAGTGRLALMRAADADALAVANIPAEAAMVWNGATFDRLPGNAASGAKVQQATYQGKTGGQAVIDTTTSGDNTIVAADATRRIKVYAYDLVVAGSVSVRWKSGAATNLSGAKPFAANGGISKVGQPSAHLLETAVNQALVLNLSAAVQVSGELSYFLE